MRPLIVFVSNMQDCVVDQSVFLIRFGKVTYYRFEYADSLEIRLPGIYGSKRYEPPRDCRRL